METYRKSSDLNDPRGCGFRSRVSVEYFQSVIDTAVKQLDGEEIRSEFAAGRVLVEPVLSRVSVPHFARAAMDGFAIQAADSFGADLYNPAALKMIGRSRPGAAFSDQVHSGQAVAIATGAPIPDGADSVVPVEACEQLDGRVLIHEPVAPGRHVGAVGEDVKTGDCLFNVGRIIRPQDLGLLSGTGVSSVSVVRKPRIAILITGDELLPAFSPPSNYRISDMNSVMLAGLAERDGALATRIGPCIDEFEDLKTTITKLCRSEEFDAIFISGGSSTGPEDHAPGIVRELGELLVHGVALRPASPTGFGCIGNVPVLLIPGNPVSSLCAYDFFGGRIVRTLAGRSKKWQYPLANYRLSSKVSSSVGRTDYVRVKFSPDGESIEPIAVGGASILSGVSQAVGFLVVPSDLEGYPSGTVVHINCYDTP